MGGKRGQRNVDHRGSEDLMPDDISRSRLSKEELFTEIDVTKAGVAIDPTANAVFVAVISIGNEPADADWHAAQWQHIGGQYSAVFTIGPGSPIGQLPIGTYRAWSRVTTADEDVKEPSANRIYIF
jgi:hypothetical protein